MVDIADLFEFHEAVRHRLGDIAKYDYRELLKGLDSPDLLEVASTVALTIDLAKKSEALPFQILPSGKLNEINETAKDVLSRFEEIKQLPVGEFNEEVKGEYLRLAATNSNCQTFQNLLIPNYAYLSLNAPDFRIQKSDKIVSDLQKTVASELETFKAKKAELDSIIEIARDTAAQAGVAQHAEAFSEIAVEHASASKRWLIAASILIIITIVVAITTLYLLPSFGESRDAVVIQRIIAKLIILSSLYYGAAWSAKNYRIHRHLSVVNMHRHNALKTFEAFIKAASGDQETKSAVLLETTRSIFAPTNTGYLGGEEESSSDRIIEIVKTVGSNAK